MVCAAGAEESAQGEPQAATGLNPSWVSQITLKRAESTKELGEPDSWVNQMSLKHKEHLQTTWS